MALLDVFPISTQVLEGGTENELHDLETLLEFLGAELSTHRNFELNQALLRATLRLHGDTVMREPALRARAARLQSRLEASWHRLDGLLQSARCVVGFLGNLQ